MGASFCLKKRKVRKSRSVRDGLQLNRALALETASPKQEHSGTLLL